MNTSNLSKERVLRIIGIIILLIGIIIAFCSKEIQLVDSMILDGNTGKVPVGITLHITVIQLIILASAILLFYANKTSTNNTLTPRQNLIFHIIYVMTGLFFSIATGCSERSSHLLEYYESIYTRPSWYIQDIISMPGFNNIPDVAQDLSNTATVFYILTIIGIVVLFLYYVNNVQEIKNKILALIGKK